MRVMFGLMTLGFLASCSVQTRSNGSEARADSGGGGTVACELSMATKSDSKLTDLDARSCNDAEVQSTREHDLFTGLCKLSSSWGSLSYRMSEKSCDVKAAAAVCTAGDGNNSNNPLQKTYYYHGQNAVAADLESELKQFAESCDRLSGKLEVLQH